MTALRLGLPSKGRLQDDAFGFFASAGIKIRRSSSEREYAATLSGVENIELVLLQAGEMPGKLASGALHLAITGEDLIRERVADSARKVVLLRGLGFGRADLIVAVPNSWLDVSTMADLDEAAAGFRARHGFPLRVATKYHSLTRQFFAQKGVADYRLVDSQGATEGAPAACEAEIIADITSSGATLKANNLKILDDGLMLRSEANLCASLTADWTEMALGALRDLLGRTEARERAEDIAVLRAAAPRDAVAALGPDAHLAGWSESGAIIHAPRAQASAMAARLAAIIGAPVEISAPQMLHTAQNGAYEAFAASLKSLSA